MRQRKPRLRALASLLRKDNVPGKRRIESVFLNIPYDVAFENLYLAYIVALTRLGLAIKAAIFQELKLAALVKSQTLIARPSK